MCLTVCLFVHQSVSRLKVCQLVNLSEFFPRVCHCVCLFGNEPEIRCILSVFFLFITKMLAREQLSLALKLVLADFKRSSVIRQRLRDVVNMEERMERL